jgi:hypothetical protein
MYKIRIRIDSHWFGSPGCGSGSRSKEIDQINNLTWFSAFQKDFCTSTGLIWPITHIKYISHEKIQKINFGDGTVWTGSGSALIRIGLAPRIRSEVKSWSQIRIRGSTTKRLTEKHEAGLTMKVFVKKWPWAFPAVEVKLAYSILVFALTFPIKMPASSRVQNWKSTFPRWSETPLW